MAAVFGQVGEFVEGDEDWSQYVDRLKHFFVANDVTDAGKKRAIFLSVVGPKTYKLLSSLISPATPGEKDFGELVGVLKKHYSPQPSVIVQRYKFNSRFRQPGESVAAYVAELRAIAKTCDYGDTLEEMLRDRLVCGIGNDKIQEQLLSEPDLTLQRALELAQGIETAARNVKELQTPQRSLDIQVHQVSPCGVGGTPSRCYRCGRTNHAPAQCPFIKARCHNCGKIGHIKKVCRSGRKPAGGRGIRPGRNTVKTVQAASSSAIAEEYSMHHVSVAGQGKPLEVQVSVDGKSLCMELDTGAAVSLVSAETFQRLWPGRELQESSTRLCTYSREPLPVLGKIDVVVKCGDSSARLPLVVIEGNGPNLFGRNWLQAIKLDWGVIHQLQVDSLQELMAQYKGVFEPGLGKMTGYQAKIHIDPNAAPRFCRARPVPYAMRVKVEQALDRMVEQGILEPVQYAEWAAPIVPVLKGDGTVRICGDFKVTVNRVARVDKYPIPRIEDLLASLAGGKIFSKLDMSQAYLQLSLDPKSRDLVVVNTHKGLFRYTRLPYGIASAPGIFQRVMEGMLSGIKGVVVYLDDILVVGETEAEHKAALGEVLKRLEGAGLRLRRDKCTFMAASVTYLGYRIDHQGLHPVPEKVKAVHSAPEPRNVTELKAYLGLLAYYSRFLPQVASVLNPLYTLLRKGEPWEWKGPQRQAFLASKRLLTTSSVLAHYDPRLPLVLACDASAYGIGAVLSHRLADGTEKPVAFTSRTLSQSERRYSQIEKEGLACVFGVKHFHMYLYGRHFYLQTDHKPLTALFGESRAVPHQASGRIQRWAWILAAYEYTLQFRPTEKHGNADAMSRLPLPDCPAEVPVPREVVLLVEGLQESPISTDQIRTWTRRDPLLSKVLSFIMRGWPKGEIPAEMKPYWNRRTELSVEAGCLLWGTRVVVPPQGRSHALLELHAAHPGMSRMKAMARMFCWWPGMDHEIETLVRGCSICQQERPGPPQSPLHPWQWPSRPWSRLHLDYAGPFMGHMFLVLIDAHSKWLEVYQMSAATSNATIQRLRTTFAQFGLPDTVVTDNGTCFTSSEFAEFLQRNGIRHIKSAPYHPATNGLAERAVRIFKTGMRKMREGGIQEKLARMLFQYRITPQTTTGVSPAELLMGRRLRSRLDSLKPDLERKVETSQYRQKTAHDTHASERKLEGGKTVYARNFVPGCKPKWLPGTVRDETGPVSCEVELEDGTVCRRHYDHVRERQELEPRPTELNSSAQGESSETTESSLNDMSESTAILPDSSSKSVETTLEPALTTSYPKRDRKPPDRYM